MVEGPGHVPLDHLRPDDATLKRMERLVDRVPGDYAEFGVFKGEATAEDLLGVPFYLVNSDVETGLKNRTDEQIKANLRTPMPRTWGGKDSPM